MKYSEFKKLSRSSFLKVLSPFVFLRQVSNPFFSSLLRVVVDILRSSAASDIERGFSSLIFLRSSKEK